MSENIAAAVGDKLSTGSGSSVVKKKAESDANSKQPHHHNIDYNKDLEGLLKDNAEECESLGILHRASYEKYNRLSNYINIPVIILSSAIGFATGIDIGYEKMNIILGIGSIFVGIIKSIDTYFQLGKRSESHRLCSLQYQQVHKKIQIELALKRPQRQTAKDMMAVIKTDIKNLQDISPLIDQDIIDAYNQRYGKYTTVKKPNFVNGLTEVVVNDTDADGEDVLHSRPRSEAGSDDSDDNLNNNTIQRGGGDGGGGGNIHRRGSENRRRRSIHSLLPNMNKNIKVDAFGENQRQTPSQNLQVPIPVANLVFKNDHLRESPQLQQLQQLQQLEQLKQLQQLQQLQQVQQVQQQQLPILPPNLTPPLLFSQSNSGGSGGSRGYTPNSEIVTITSTQNPNQLQNQALNINDNVVVNVIDDSFDTNSNSNGQMM